jgi:hypothetical protein
MMSEIVTDGFLEASMGVTILTLEVFCHCIIHHKLESFICFFMYVSTAFESWV